jgi:hypothetical protein
MKLMLSGHHKVPTKPRLTWVPRLRGSPWPAFLSASPHHHKPASLFPSSAPVDQFTTPASSARLCSSLPKPLKTISFRTLLLCQPGRLQYHSRMPEASKLPPRGHQIDSRTSHPSQAGAPTHQMRPLQPRWIRRQPMHICCSASSPQNLFKFFRKPVRVKPKLRELSSTSSLQPQL